MAPWPDVAKRQHRPEPRSSRSRWPVILLGSAAAASVSIQAACWVAWGGSASTGPSASSSNPLGRRVRGAALQLRAAVGEVSKWRAGPADVYTGPAQKALYLLEQNPELFASAVEEELERLHDQKEEAKQQAQSEGEASVEKDALVLRQRVKEVRELDRMRTAMELLYLQVCNKFIRLQVPLIPPLKDGGDVRFGGPVNLQGLTDIYSQEAVELVKEHLFGILGAQGNPFGPAAVVQIALFQCGQVYAMSALFGYYVRRVDARFQLEKLAGAFGAWGDENAEPKAVELGDEAVSQSLRDYVTTFGPEELQRMRSIATVEAQMAMETQVSSLFGDLRVLKNKLLEAVGMVMSNEEATQKLQKAIEEKKVESVRITTDDLRRLVLEAVAFGALLYESEKEADTFYELTPSGRTSMGALTGDDDMDGRMLPPGGR
eukprot:TRINITY_DN101610_c0_g1_i1.p1 TRINITY_DN101610_c0_g1~~TRINITY_DN101610_c0_g1_i1.p1  ORF type:complete len:432 (-),score=103.89 TRINITY_DN101610_c0_g1_i1:129-1424(-)